MQIEKLKSWKEKPKGNFNKKLVRGHDIIEDKTDEKDETQPSCAK